MNDNGLIQNKAAGVKSLPFQRTINFRWVIATLLTLAFAIRVIWCLSRESRLTGEAFQVAATLARTGRFADAYGPGTGPTAHLPPIGPAIAGSVYHVFGIDTLPANLILFSYTIILVVISYALGQILFARIGSPRIARVAGLLTLAIAPIYLKIEVSEGRVWEHNLTVVSYLTFLCVIVGLERARRIGWGAISAVTLLAAVIFFINPVIGVASYMIAGVFILRHFRPLKAIAIVGLSLIVLVTVLAPWAIRNQNAMHAFIPLRSNIGLELAVANYPEAVDADDRAAVFVRHFNAIHPMTAEGHRRLIANGGEVAYSNKLKRETLTWIKHNPVDFLRLAVVHFAEFVFPRPWHFTFGKQVTTKEKVQAALASIIGLVGLAGAVLSLIYGSWSYRYVALAILLPALGYASFQPTPRYTYLIYCLQVFCAADLIARLVTRRFWNAGDQATGPAHSRFSIPTAGTADPVHLDYRSVPGGKR